MACVHMHTATTSMSSNCLTMCSSLGGRETCNAPMTECIWWCIVLATSHWAPCMGGEPALIRAYAPLSIVAAARAESWYAPNQ